MTGIPAGIFEQLLNGLTVGIVLILIAAGLSIIFGVMDVINFAHGEFFALGGYFAVALVAPIGPSGFWLALLVAPILVALVGIVTERYLIKPVYDRNPLYHVLLTFGLVLIINDLIHLVWGGSPKYLPQPTLLDQSVTLFGFTYSAYNYALIVFGAAVAAGVWLLMRHTRYGIIVRAGSEDREMVRNLGIPIERYYTAVFGFGAFLAGLGGVALGGYQSIHLGMGNEIIIPAFVIVVLGGLGSFRGAVIGGLGVGLIQSFTSTYVPILSGLAIFILMIVVLLVRPHGLFGSPEAEAGDGGAILTTSYDGVLSTETGIRLGVGVTVLLFLIPLGSGVLYSSYVVTFLTEVLIWTLFAISLDLVLGYVGLVSLGHAMFYGAGAYVAFLSVQHFVPSAIVALLAVVLFSAVLAYVVGTLSIRVSGIYFAMITLAFAELLRNAVLKSNFLGTSDGLFGARPLFGVGGVGVHLDEIHVELLGFTFEGADAYYWLLCVLVLGVFLFCWRLMHSPFGTVLKAIRENEQRAAFIGYDTRKHKRRIFVVSGVVAGLAGALFTLERGYAAPSFLHWVHSGDLLVMTVLGGMGTLYGPMFGVGLVMGLEEVLLGYIEQWRLVIGLIFVLVVIFSPRGLLTLPVMVVRAVRRSRRAEVADADPAKDDDTADGGAR